MADSPEPKKETVRITIPLRPPGKPPAGEAVRVNLPSRPPPNGSGGSATPESSQSETPFALEEPAGASPIGSAPVTSGYASAQAVALPDEPISPPTPKKETARISVLPDPPKATPGVQMKKTQPLITMPETAPPSAPVTVAPADARSLADAIPKPLCWAVFGLSLLTLIIQIWNYFS